MAGLGECFEGRTDSSTVRTDVGERGRGVEAGCHVSAGTRGRGDKCVSSVLSYQVGV